MVLSFTCNVLTIYPRPHHREVDMSKLKEIRESRFLTQAELAEMVGCAEHTVSNWERGKQKPMFKSIRKLAKVLNVNPNDIDFDSRDTHSA